MAGMVLIHAGMLVLKSETVETLLRLSLFFEWPRGHRAGQEHEQVSVLMRLGGRLRGEHLPRMLVCRAWEL